MHIKMLDTHSSTLRHTSNRLSAAVAQTLELPASPAFRFAVAAFHAARSPPDSVKHVEAEPLIFT